MHLFGGEVRPAQTRAPGSQSHRKQARGKQHQRHCFRCRSGPVFIKTFILMLGVLLNRTKSFYVGVVS